MAEQAPVRASLLIELGCEELPPKSLDRLSAAFFDGVCSRLEKAGIEFDPSHSRPLHSPRRLAMMLAGVAGRQPDRTIDRRGPALQAAFDSDGKPTSAALGFAKSVGLEVSELETLRNDKGEWLYCRIIESGKALHTVLFPILQDALNDMPVARPMRWGSHDFSFVRPVHWLVVMHGDKVLEGSLYGLNSSRHSRGHRVHHADPVAFAHADHYLTELKRAHVLADPEERRSTIHQAVLESGVRAGSVARVNEALLAEVNNLVEWPVPVTCSFDESFLTVPQEALIASMEDHQKFFPLLDSEGGSLRPQFVTITNLESADTESVRQGYERVIRPRLADAQFFWNQDRKRPLADHCPALDDIVFQKKIGSVGDKSRRLAIFSTKLADFLSLDQSLAQRAAELCKCDLVSQMVGEFPELQGTMGGYYAQACGEHPAVAQAIAEHYLPRFSGDELPASNIGGILALADRLDTLVGIFAAGLKPTGNKDPFALRRAALGVVRLLTETDLDHDLDRLLAISANALADTLQVSPETLAEVRSFILDRARQHFRDQDIDTRLVNAALAAPLSTLADLDARIRALSGFMQLPAADALVAANKRIGNILRKSEEKISMEIDEDRLALDAEKHVFDEVIELEAALEPRFQSGDYAAGLARLARLQVVIEPFFDTVMVMDEDPGVRANRLALLRRLKTLFDRVGDLSLAG